MQPYQPSNQVPLTGMLLLAAAAIFGGAAIGVAVHFAGKLVYLIIVFPLLMGIAAGFLLAQAIKLGKVRNPTIAVLFAVLAAVMVYGSYWAAEYFGFRADIRTYINEEYGPQDQADIDAFIDEVLIEETTMPGFTGFFRLSSMEGVTLSRVGSGSGDGINLGEVGSYIYYLIELIIILVAALGPARRAARQPFCETCEVWYGKEQYLGSFPLDQTAGVIGLLENGQFSDLGGRIGPMLLPGLSLFTRVCETCRATNTHVALKRITVNRKGQKEIKVLKEGLISSSQLAALNAAQREQEAHAAQSAAPAYDLLRPE